MLRNGGYEDNPGYELTVHPPLAKQLIAIGEWLFGYNGWGWRFSSAIAGTLMILLIVRIARRLTRSTLQDAPARTDALACLEDARTLGALRVICRNLAQSATIWRAHLPPEYVPGGVGGRQAP